MLLLSLVLMLAQDAEIDRLVRALDDDDASKRAKAAATLETLLLSKGPQGLKLLEGVGAPPSLEARSHLDAIKLLLTRVEACRKSLGLFDAFELPDIRMLKF